MPFFESSDEGRVDWDVSLEYQDEVHMKAQEYGEPAVFIEGVLNDTTVFDLSGFVDDRGDSYQYVILGHKFQNPWSNVLYVQYTNDKNVFNQWVDEFESSQEE